MKNVISVKTVVNTSVALVAAGLVLGALAVYGRRIPVVGDAVSRAAEAAK